MTKLMYSEAGGFHYFPDGMAPAGWVDGEPIRQALMSAKALLDAKRVPDILPEVPQPPQDTKRRPGRPPKNVTPVENGYEHIPDTD
jgi:hypothetical protein